MLWLFQNRVGPKVATFILCTLLPWTVWGNCIKVSPVSYTDELVKTFHNRSKEMSASSDYCCFLLPTVLSEDGSLTSCMSVALSHHSMLNSTVQKWKTLMIIILHQCHPPTTRQVVTCLHCRVTASLRHSVIVDNWDDRKCFL